MISVRTFGHCSASPPTMISAYERSNWRELVGFEGDYILVFEEPDRTTIVSSLYSVLPYFLGPGGKHSDNSTEISDGKVNLDALATLIGLSHTVDRQSLLSDVERMPARSTAVWRRDAWSIQTFDWHDFHERTKSTAGDAIDAFRSAVARVAGEQPVISMSGGFDSRLILAGLLANKATPTLLTMGNPRSGDVTSARRLSELTSLPFKLRELDPDEYLENADHISHVTCGQKTADHWHSFFYARGNDFHPSANLLVGGNGEFARSYYLDRGLATLPIAASSLSPESAKRFFWRVKLNRSRFSPRQVAMMPPETRRMLSKDATIARADELARLCPGGLFEGFDRFYLDQRVRHFIGYGMRLISGGLSWRSPFLDRDWINAIHNLPRQWKLSSNWHRHAIRALAPDLMKVPEEGYRGPLRLRGHIAQSVLWPKSERWTPYANYSTWFSTAKWANALDKRRPYLSPLFGDDLVSELIRDLPSGSVRADTVGLMISIGSWYKSISSHHARRNAPF